MKVPGTIFEAIGGHEPVDRIIEALYKRIGEHPKLITIFPDDLKESARKQRLFLIQFFGDPQLYNEDRGHPIQCLKEDIWSLKSLRREKKLGLSVW